MMTPTRPSAVLLFLAAFLPLSLYAQEPDTVEPDTVEAGPIAAGETRTDSLPAAVLHAYTVELAADRFVYGELEQRTVDVTITVLDPDGDVVRRFDNRRRGAETFHWSGTRAGSYRIELAPAADATGSYALRLERVEPIADDPAERTSQILAPYSGAVPGGVVGVFRDGQPVFARGYGTANLSHDVPFTATTRTNIGSTSKQFTAFAIGLLANRGALELDDDVREHIPELPDFGAVTLRHLLTHTSGYREFLNTLALTGRRLDEGDYVDRDEIIGIVQRQPELQNEPGAEWNYNNTGYALLAMVVERVTDTPFPDWMRTNVFEPLGMENTVVRAAPSQVVENSAQGYIPAADGGYRQAPDLGGAMGAGGIYTTVGDLARWIANLGTGALGGEALIDAMTTPYVLTTGDTTDYGLGLFVDEYRGLRRVHHGGADIAHRSMLAYYPETGTGVVVLSNNAAFPGSAHGDVVDAFLADALEPEEGEGDDASLAVDAPFDPALYDPVTFDEVAGRYSLDEMPSFILSFFREGDTLYTQATGQPRIPVRPTSDSSFTLVGVEASVTFHKDESGDVTHATLHQNGDHRATRLEGDRWSPSAEELEAFTGRYFSEELETFYTVALEDGTLRLRHRRFDEALELEPGKEDTFSAGFPIASMEFERDENGDVAAFLASNGRTRGVRFERVP